MSTEPAQHLTIDVIDDGDAVVLVVAGELDPLSGPDLTRAMEAALASSRTAVVLDLADVGFIDSSGLRTLLEAHTRAQELGSDLILRRPSPAARRLLDITDLTSVFSILEDGDADRATFGDDAC